MKTHMSFATKDLDASVAFYRTLLGVEPAKQYKDYALFLIDDPGLELALSRDADASVAGGAHYGIAVDSADFVRNMIRRLSQAGLPVDTELDETCCYAVQDKVWATDPDGRRWETYHVVAEANERDGSTETCCTSGATNCC